MDEIRAAITQGSPQVIPPVPDPAGTDIDMGDEEPPDSRYVSSNLVTADQMQRDVDGKVQQYCDHCARIVDMWVTYVQEVDSYSVQGAAMKHTWLPEPLANGYTACIYVQNATGESTSTPHVRGPRFRADVLRKHVKSVALACGDEDALPPGFIFLSLMAVSVAMKHRSRVALFGQTQKQWARQRRR